MTPTSGKATDTLFEIKAVWQTESSNSDSMMFKYYAMDSGKTSKKNRKYLGKQQPISVFREHPQEATKVGKTSVE